MFNKDAESSNNQHKLLEVGIDVDTRSFHLVGGVDEDMLRFAFVSFAALRTKSTHLPITIYLTTNGGSVEDGLGIYDLIQSQEAEVTIHILGYAHSMGCIILQAGDRRLMSKNSVLMAHWGTQQVEDSNPENFKRKLAYNATLDKKCDSILLEKMKEKKKTLTLAKVAELTQHDWYLTPAEAIKQGLCDEVI